jgi:hypothetical protein
MLGTRVDIAFVVGKLARFASNPSNIHFTTIKRVYKYLKVLKTMELLIIKTIVNIYLAIMTLTT